MQLTADLFGDWREEVIWRAADNTSLRIYSTTIPAVNRIYTLMHDPQYRLGIAWQNMVVASGASQISAAPFASCSCDVVTSAAAIAPTRQR